MLVLSRWKNERIIINGNIIVEVVGVREDGRVHLGIEAPEDVPIHREEVWDAIQRKQETAT